MDALNSNLRPTLDEADKIVGQRVRQARVLAGFQAGAMAQMVGSTRAMQYRYESGETPMRVGALARYAAICEKPIAWFFDDLSAISAPEPRLIGERLGIDVTPEMLAAMRLFNGLSIEDQGLVISTMRSMGKARLLPEE